jgi:hypothetical protein
MVMDQEGANEITRKNASYANRGDGRAGHQMREDKCVREKECKKRSVCEWARPSARASGECQKQGLGRVYGKCIAPDREGANGNNGMKKV